MTESRKASWSKWYENNKSKHNEARKARYHADPEVRIKAINRQKSYRERNAGQHDKSHVRVVAGKKREVFRIGEASSQVGRDEQTLRKWEKQGLVPAPTVVSKHRYYTQNQINLMRELAELIDKLRYPTGQEALDLAIKKKSKEISTKWGK